MHACLRVEASESQYEAISATSGWVTGRASGPWKTCTYLKRFSSRQVEEKTNGELSDMTQGHLANGR